MAAQPLPTFVILGVQKSATRWLRWNLGLHPDVFTAASEVGFFSGAGKFAKGAEWYAERSSRAGPASASWARRRPPT